MLSIRGGSGLGDALYVQAVARHLLKRVQRIEVCTSWPDVFRPLASRVTISPFRRDRITRLAHYSRRRHVFGTTQFEDVCNEAGIREPVDFRIDWQPLNGALIDRLRGAGKPVVVVQMPRAPFGRSDGFGAEFLPDCRVIQRAIDAVRDRAYLVQIGKGETLFPFTGIDLDLTNRTTVTDVLDIGSAVHGFLGYCSFIVPLAETFAKPAQLVWSRRGLCSRHTVVRSMTPRKILHRPTSRAVIDDCSEAELTEAMDAFCDQIGSARALPGEDGGDRRERAGLPG